jgi:hypothetical protein
MFCRAHVDIVEVGFVELSPERRVHVAAAVCALIALTAAAMNAGGTAAPPLRFDKRFSTQFPADASTNWAGYAVTSPDPAAPLSFTSVTGTWKQTDAACGATDSQAASSVWVGLGGFYDQSQALEQIGTSADCLPTGPPSYYGWYELVPDPPVSFAIKIRPGDVITTSVDVKGRTITLQLRNRTRGTVVSKRATDASPDLSSAEWIAEAPSTCGSGSCAPVPLANFGAVTFSRIATVGNGHPGTLTDPAWAPDAIQLVPGAQGSGGNSSTAGTCTPARLSRDGGSFLVSWTSIAAAGSC